VNYSRNLGLEKVSADSKWIIFLDDDDYLAPDALQTFHDLIMHHQNTKWFITNRAFKNGKPVTIAPKSDTTYLYALSYLVFKRIKGDVTHCIETKLLIHNHITFSNYVKQAEEWFFFYQVGLHTKMYYHDHNSTITDGYNSHTGLNFRKRTKGDRFEALSQLTYEAIHKRIIRPTFIVYIFLRLIAIFVR
jgi:glycosyltransferase involved in cell wall biosynthesis